MGDFQTCSKVINGLGQQLPEANTSKGRDPVIVWYCTYVIFVKEVTRECENVANLRNQPVASSLPIPKSPIVQVEFDPSDVLSRSVTILIFLKQLLFTKCYDFVWFCRSPSLPLVNIICSYSNQECDFPDFISIRSKSHPNRARRQQLRSWEVGVECLYYKLKLFLKGIQEISSIEAVQLLHRAVDPSEMISLKLEAKAEDDDTAEKEVEKDWLLTFHMMNLEKDLDFVRSFAVPAWHWNDFTFEDKYEKIRELRFTPPCTWTVKSTVSRRRKIQRMLLKGNCPKKPRKKKRRREETAAQWDHKGSSIGR